MTLHCARGVLGNAPPGDFEKWKLLGCAFLHSEQKCDMTWLWTRICHYVWRVHVTCLWSAYVNMRNSHWMLALHKSKVFKASTNWTRIQGLHYILEDSLLWRKQQGILNAWEITGFAQSWKVLVFYSKSLKSPGLPKMLEKSLNSTIRS